MHYAIYIYVVNFTTQPYYCSFLDALMTYVGHETHKLECFNVAMI